MIGNVNVLAVKLPEEVVGIFVLVPKSDVKLSFEDLNVTFFGPDEDLSQ